MKKNVLKYLIVVFFLLSSSVFSQNYNNFFDFSSDTLYVPETIIAKPKAGRRVIVHSPEYLYTHVYHTIYLPYGWKKGKSYPIIFEYTGNYFPNTGSTGEVEDAALGYGLTGGQFIWVVLPYVSVDGLDNEVKWWGDEKASVQYAKVNVPRIIEQYGANPDAVFLCGFSRGAIGVNYIGLYDDEVAQLWSAFITHDHFDGVKAWVKPWGQPLEKYRQGATKRLKRINGRPYFVSNNGDSKEIENLIDLTLSDKSNFRFQKTNTSDIFGVFPNPFAVHSHCDTWPLVPSSYRDTVWEWITNIIEE